MCMYWLGVLLRYMHICSEMPVTSSVWLDHLASSVTRSLCCEFTLPVTIVVTSSLWRVHCLVKKWTRHIWRVLRVTSSLYKPYCTWQYFTACLLLMQLVTLYISIYIFMYGSYVLLCYMQYLQIGEVMSLPNLVWFRDRGDPIRISFSNLPW